MQLGGHGVDRVDHIVKLRQIERGVRGIKFLPRVHGAARVDVRNAAAHDLDLGLPGGGGERDQLAVAVGERDLVVVDQRQLADACAGERLAGKRAHPAYAEHRNMGGGELFYGRCAEQQLCAGKFMQHGNTSQIV